MKEMKTTLEAQEVMEQAVYFFYVFARNGDAKPFDDCLLKALVEIEYISPDAGIKSKFQTVSNNE